MKSTRRTMKTRHLAALLAALLLTLGAFPAASATEAQGKAASWDLEKATPLPYVVAKIDKDYRAAIKRTKWMLRILPVSRDAKGNLVQAASDQASKEQLAATVIAAARYGAETTGGDFVHVILDSQAGGSFGSCQLATAQYAPDGRGVSGSQDWTWQMVSAAENGLSEQELHIQRLWGELRDSFQKGGVTDEPALKAAIGKRLGLPAGQIAMPFRMLEDVPMSLIERVRAVPPQENN